MFPVTSDPCCPTELVTATAMYAGRVSGGVEAFPVRAVQAPPHWGGVVLVVSAYPRKAFGTDAPFSRGLDFDHWESQKVIVPPLAAAESLMTKAVPPG